MQWHTINRNTSRQDLDRQLKKLIKLSDYGFAQEQWNLSALILEPTFGTRCFQLLAGEQPNGKKTDDGPMMAEDGSPLKFRLQVLTRQACAEDKHGTPINGTKYQTVKASPGDNTLYPDRFEKPEPGDIVKIKKNHRTVDPETNESITPPRRNAMLAKGQEVWIFARKVVDKDLCIWCSLDEAHQLLSLNGARLLKYPEVQRRDKQLDDANPPKPQREIANWHFKEVPHDYRLETIQDIPKTAGDGVTAAKGRSVEAR